VLQFKFDINRTVTVGFKFQMYPGNEGFEIRESSPFTGLEWPRGFQEVKVPRFHDTGTGMW